MVYAKEIWDFYHSGETSRNYFLCNSSLGRWLNRFHGAWKYKQPWRVFCTAFPKHSCWLWKKCFAPPPQNRSFIVSSINENRQLKVNIRNRPIWTHWINFIASLFTPGHGLRQDSFSSFPDVGPATFSFTTFLVLFVWSHLGHLSYQPTGILLAIEFCL